MAVHEDSETIGKLAQSPLKIHTMPAAPLQQLSPERLNQRLVHSPSLPIDLEQSAAKLQHRLSDASDVKARVAMINSMSINGSPTRVRSPAKSQPGTPSQAALQRAVLGREQAESMSTEILATLESAKCRERLASERAESLLEQLASQGARYNHEHKVFQREMKSSRKNEYKAQMAVIQLQQELQDLKKQFGDTKVQVDHEKVEKDKARQEAFERAYAIQGITEELQTLKERLKVVEKERDTMLAVQEKRQVNALPLAFMQPQTIVNESSSPKKVDSATQAPEISSNASLQEEIDVGSGNGSLDAKCRMLERQINCLRQEQRESKELIHFMNMQCQFLACPCRLAERDNVRFVHDHEYDDEIVHTSKKRKLDIQPPRKLMSWMRRREANKEQKQAQNKIQSAFIVEQGQQDAQIEAALAGRMDVDEEMIEAAPLPPTESAVVEPDEVSEVMDVETAAQIPLPSPTNTPEHTSQLEDITQMIIEPGVSTQAFSFSKSASERGPLLDAVPQFSHSQNAVRLSDALFDISPPKASIPRPSTAMGILTVASPIRLVPDSPDRSLSVRDSDVFVESHPPRTIRVALNDTSPVRNARDLQHLQPTRDSRRSTRGISPADAADPSSPASNTLFPITPMTKHLRTSQHSHTQPRPRSDHIQSQDSHTLVTSVPLRDDTQHLQPHLQHQTLKDPLAHIPGTPVTREAALAQIRARRDRARSVNTRRVKSEDLRNVKAANTEGANVDLDGDEVETRTMKTPGGTARRDIKLKSLGARLGLDGAETDRGRDRTRDFSQASAPGRF